MRRIVEMSPRFRARMTGVVYELFFVMAVHASGAYAYDATLADMARDESNVIVREAGIGLEYPTRDLHLDEPERRGDVLGRPLALGLLGVGALVVIRQRRRAATAPAA